jgi:citrate lyase subunit beta / citryl-CoA lyase
MIRPRRSVLYMPGSNARALEKARTLAVDGVILDLEDSVAPDAKVEARARVMEAVKAGGFGHREVFVRTNGLDTEWGNDDLAAAAAAVPDAILVPKVSTSGQIELIGQRLLDIHAGLRTRLWIMIETPLAIFNAPALAACAKDSETRLAGFVLGTNDLAKETRARIVPGRAPMLSWLSACIAAARIYGIDVLDGVYNDIGNAEGFAAECAQARDMGFDGKTLIHPSQVEPCNAAFSPTAAELADAKKIIAAFDAPENENKGVVALDGRMVERMHADMARRTVAIAEAIAASEDGRRTTEER